ncbi:Hypothetical protein NTJ_05220 [Nesidiocoris tenuis]|uniref:Uncharacterized protein n=1 Tax=Nesidiocoris tenuis TaxID=355587 RepID=A0ABN7AJI1_9HEMI|nr:Hypothetical protein NTJ_05220 [Nesidiocoris tenuis]
MAGNPGGAAAPSFQPIRSGRFPSARANLSDVNSARQLVIFSGKSPLGRSSPCRPPLDSLDAGPNFSNNDPSLGNLPPPGKFFAAAVFPPNSFTLARFSFGSAPHSH